MQFKGNAFGQPNSHGAPEYDLALSGSPLTQSKHQHTLAAVAPCNRNVTFYKPAAL